MSRTRAFLVALMLVGLGATRASAGVQVRLGVRPDTLRHCGQGQLALALWNDDAQPLRVRVYVSLAYESAEIGPVQLRTRLGPNELKQRAFDYPVPAALPIGHYALRMLAVASDSSRSEAIAPFVVLGSACTIGDAPPTPASVLLAVLAVGTGLDFPTPTVRGSWGALKQRYDSKAR